MGGGGSHAPEMVELALDQTLHHLGLEYLDLYLMHWPVASDHGRNVIHYLEVRPPPPSPPKHYLPTSLTLLDRHGKQ